MDITTMQNLASSSLATSKTVTTAHSSDMPPTWYISPFVSCVQKQSVPNILQKENKNAFFNACLPIDELQVVCHLYSDLAYDKEE